MRISGRVVVALALAAAPAAGQIRNPCNVITKAEAEALVGSALIGPQPSPQGTLCKYYEAGYGESPGKVKLVTIGVWIDDQPDEEAINTRRLAAVRDSSLLPLSIKEMGGPGDAAIWVWAGNRLGALYTFRGGNTQVAVKISGISQAAALAAATRWAIRAMGSGTHTTYEYAERLMPMEFKDYYHPRLLSALYLGTLKQIPDDPMTRNYVWSLSRALNGLCPSIPEVAALLEYGMYNEVHGQADMLKAALAGNAAQMFHKMEGMMRRLRPHILEIAEADAEEFVVSQQFITKNTDNPMEPDAENCMTTQIRHLYENIAVLVRDRSGLPPDVPDDAGFMAQLRPDAQKQLGFDPRAPRAPSAALAMKKGCSDNTPDSRNMEIYCRCLVDAALDAGLPDAEMRAIGASFDARTLQQIGERYPKFGNNKRDCLH